MAAGGLLLARVARRTSDVMKRSLSLSGILWNEDEILQKAKEKVNQLTADPGNDVKLKLYSFYKQVRA